MATTFVLIRQMLSVAFEAVEVFGLSAALILATPTSGRPVVLRFVTVNQATSGRFLCTGISLGDIGSLFFFFVHFPRFLTIFGATFEKNTNFVMRLSRQAHDREICLNPAVAILRRTSHCAETARFLPPPLFFGGTQHPLI